MSPQLLAVAGVVLGAILAGAGNLLLTWRNETIQARTGVYLIRRVLEDARKEVARLAGADEPRFRPEKLPDNTVWAEYRAPVSARLPLARLQKIDEAMRALDKLNASAARAGKRGDEREARVYAAAKRRDYVAQKDLETGRDPALLSQPVIDALPGIRHTIDVALEDLLAAAPSGLPGRTWNLKAFPPWFRFHWRSLTAMVVVALLVTGFIRLSTPGASPVSSVQKAFSAHFGDPAFAACEAVHDHEDDFSCVVIKRIQPAQCGKVADRAASRRLFVSEGSGQTAATGKTCGGGVVQADAFAARRQHDDDCAAFFETAISNVPTGVKPSSPGFLRRIKTLLRRPAGSGTDSGLPPIIVPDSAFTAEC